MSVVVDRASDGDAGVLTALVSLGHWLGIGAADLTNILGSGSIVLGGYFAGAALPAANDAIDRQLSKERSYVSLPQHPPRRQRLNETAQQLSTAVATSRLLDIP
jgi:predicted NBD/HSP70 family sugar kinase